jgi:hypothetical protein
VIRSPSASKDSLIFHAIIAVLRVKPIFETTIHFLGTDKRALQTVFE